MSSLAPSSSLALADWRRQIFDLYRAVRETANSAVAHALWRSTRDRLFAEHPVTPLLPADLAEFRGLAVGDYDPGWRFELALLPAKPLHLEIPNGTDGIVPFDRVGRVQVPNVGSLDVLWLGSYGGGLFLPVKDGLARTPGGTYGGGRYLLDTVKGADLGPGRAPDSLVVDFNFAYNPSCAYDPAWACPLAQPGNTVTGEIPVGERYTGISGH